MKYLIIIGLSFFPIQIFGQEKMMPDTIVKTIVPKPKIIFRDCSTIDNDNTPLYVVDGKVWTADEIKDIDPDTIESIKIIKSSQYFCNNLHSGTIVIKTKDLPSLPMDGTYKIEFNNRSLQNDGYITFEGNAFTMTDNHCLPYSGSIDYGKNSISVTEINPGIIIDFRASQMGNGIIYFQVHNKNQKVMNYPGIAVGSGRLIRSE